MSLFPSDQTHSDSFAFEPPARLDRRDSRPSVAPARRIHETGIRQLARLGQEPLPVQLLPEPIEKFLEHSRRDQHSRKSHSATWETDSVG